MSRPIFGVTDSPREAARKKRAAKRADALLDRDREFIWRMERGPDGVGPERLVRIRNPHYRKPVVPRLVCPDGGGRCDPRCELAEGCPGPVPNPARAEER